MKIFISSFRFYMPTIVFACILLNLLGVTTFVGAQDDPATQFSIPGRWDEVGFRSASGGGIPWDLSDSPAEAKLIMTQQGDPWLFWIDGAGGDLEDSTSPGMTEYVESPVPFHFQGSGDIYYKQYVGATLPWLDHIPGGSDGSTLIGSGGRMDVATGINGEVFVTWVTFENEIHGRLWNGLVWSPELNISGTGSVVVGIYADDKPSVAIAGNGVIVVAYTHLYANNVSSQWDIIVKKLSRHNAMTGGISWTEVVNASVAGLVNNISEVQFSGGASNSESSDSIDASVAIATDGLPVVAWAEFPTGKAPEIFVRKWDGLNWNEYGSNSASLADDDGLGGVSNDASYSIQPELAIDHNGNTVLVWVNWNDWDSYEKAGIYVKKFVSGVWSDYQAGSSTEAGIAPLLPPLILGDVEPPGYGWYYQPSLVLDATGQPLITWGGHRQNEPFYDRGMSDGNPGFRLTCYASYYHNNGTSTAFHTLTANAHSLTPDLNDVADNIGRDNATLTAELSYLPNAMFDSNGDVIMAYTWRESAENEFHLDSEIFVQKWNFLNKEWTVFGRGSNSNGNTIINQTAFGESLFFVGPSFVTIKTQLANVDFDGDSSTESDLLLLNNLGSTDGEIFHFSRKDGVWSSTSMATNFGMIFEIKGEPEIEFDVAGPTVLAYLDDISGDPFVKKWNTASKAWDIVGGASLNPGVPGNKVESTFNLGISVQQGPNDEIMVVYLARLDDSDVAYARLWDGTTWSYAGATGIVDVPTVLSTMFFADFDGETQWGEITDIDREDDDQDLTLYDTWYYENVTTGEDELKDLVKREAAKTVDVDVADILIDNTGDDVDDESEDKGIAMIFTDPDSSGEVGGALPAGGKRLTAELSKNFFLEDDDTYIIIQFDHLIRRDAAVSSHLYLHIEIDGVTLDLDLDGNNETADDAGDIAGTSGDDAIGSTDFAVIDYTIPADYLKYIDTKTDVGLAGVGLKLAQGFHTIKFRASIKVVASTTSDVLAMVALDNVVIYQRVVNDTTVAGVNTTTERWKFRDVDVVDNHIVGPPIDDPLVGTFDLQGCLKLNDVSNVAADAQYFMIEDLNQEAGGEMEVAFRFNIANTDDKLTILFTNGNWVDTDPTPKVTNVLYAEEVDFNEFIENPESVIFTENTWWSWSDIFTEYWHINVRTPLESLIPTATDTKVIIYYEPVDATSELYIDNLVVLGVNAGAAVGGMNTTRPIATLLPTASTTVDKKFAVGLTAHMPEVSVYAIGDTDIVKDGKILAAQPRVSGGYNAFPKQMDSGYFTFAIMEWNIEATPPQWERSFNIFAETTPINFFGFDNNLFNMPAPVNHILTGIATGPDSFVWISLQRAETDAVDSTDDGIDLINRFDIHPYTLDDAPAYWHDDTIFEVQVWRWDPLILPFIAETWVQMFGIDYEGVAGGQPPFVSRATIHGQLVSKNGQRPMVAWTDQTPMGVSRDSYALAWNDLDEIWRPMGNLSDIGSVQNNTYWSALHLHDMIIGESGDPIVGMRLKDLRSFGLREFNTAAFEVPEISVVVENLSSTSSSTTILTPSDALKFESVVPTTTNTESQLLIKITNNGVGDLALYSIKIGGFEALPGFVEGQQVANTYNVQGAKPFKFDDISPTFPTTLSDGSDGETNVLTLIITFDSAQLTSPTTGIFEGSLLIHSNATNHPSHEYELFYEVPMTVVLENDAKIAVSDSSIYFADTVFGSNDYPVQIIEITNATITTDQDSKLWVTHWGLESNYFKIIHAYFSDFDKDTIDKLEDLVTPTQQPIGYIGSQYPGNNYINKPELSTDDLELSEGDKIILTLQFDPFSVDAFDDILSIGSDDTLNPLISVNLFGLATSGAMLLVEIIDTDSALKIGEVAQDDILDFGNVINGDPNDIIIRLRNPATATSDAIIKNLVIDQPADGLITSNNYFQNDETLAPDAFVDVVLTFTALLPDVIDNGYQGVQPLVGSGNQLWPLVTIATDVPDDELVEFALSGVSVPRHGVPELSAPIINFEETILGQSTSIPFTIKNIGGAELEFTSYSFSKNPINNPRSFTVSTLDPNGVLIQPLIKIKPNKESDPLMLTFTPTSTNSSDNIMSLGIASVDHKYDVDIEDVFMRLNGIGINPILNVIDDSADGNDSDHNYEFGMVGVGNDSAVATITISNSGEDILEISPSDIELIGDPNVFKYTNIEENIQLIDNDSHEIEITFSPIDGVGSYTAILKIMSDGSEITLSGEGVTPGNVSVQDCGDPPNIITEIDFVEENGGQKIVVGGYIAAPLCLSHGGTSESYITGIEVVSAIGATTADDILADISTPFIIDQENKFALAFDTQYHTLRLIDPVYEVNITFNPAGILHDNFKQYLRIMYASSTDFKSSDLYPPIYIDLKGASVQPIIIGDDGNKNKHNFTDEFLNNVTIKLSGPGSAIIQIDDNVGMRITKIELVDTNQKSTLLIKSNGKGFDTARIGQIVGTVVKNIVLTKVVLDGALTPNGAFKSIDIETVKGSIVLHNVINGGTIQVGSSVKTFKIVSDEVFDGTVYIDGSLNTVIGKKSRFEGGLRAEKIGKVILYSMNNADISARESIKIFTLKGDFVNSRLLLGFDLGTDARIGGAVDTLVTGSELKSVLINGHIDHGFIAAGITVDDITNYFGLVNAPGSEFVNGKVGKVTIKGIVDEMVGDEFGIAAATSIGKTKVDNVLYTAPGSNGQFKLMTK